MGLQFIPCHCYLLLKANGSTCNTSIDNRNLLNLSNENIWGTKKSTANYSLHNKYIDQCFFKRILCSSERHL